MKEKNYRIAIIGMAILIIISQVVIHIITNLPNLSNPTSNTAFNITACSANPTQQNCGTPTGITCFRMNSTIIDFICIHFWIRNNNLYLQKVYIPNISN